VAEGHDASFARADALAALIAEQATELLQEGANGYFHTTDEPRELGLTPWGDLDDEQAWHTHVLSCDARVFTEIDARRQGFVAWS
jgi:hypothetical protein